MPKPLWELGGRRVDRYTCSAGRASVRPTWPLLVRVGRPEGVSGTCWAERLAATVVGHLRGRWCFRVGIAPPAWRDARRVYSVALRPAP